MPSPSADEEDLSRRRSSYSERSSVEEKTVSTTQPYLIVMRALCKGLGVNPCGGGRQRCGVGLWAAKPAAPQDRHNLYRSRIRMRYACTLRWSKTHAQGKPI